MDEIWRNVDGLEGYQVSNCGRVRSLDRTIECMGRWGSLVLKNLKGKALRPVEDADGYLQVQLGRGKARKVHHLVLEAFKGPRPAGMECAHLDGVRSNNHDSNLKWATQLENASHKRLHGTHPQGERHGMSRVTSEDVLRIREAILFGATHAALAPIYGVDRAHISNIHRGQRWSHL